MHPVRVSEILTVEEMTSADREAEAAGTPVLDLMERAGAAVAEAIQARRAQAPVQVLCGPGNNGGDGFVAARRLREAGWNVTVAAMADTDQLKGAAFHAAAAWGGPVARLGDGAADDAPIVIDAMFGAGLSRPLGPAARDALEAAQARRAWLVAVDTPSGLAGDTGASLGYAPQAALTVTFHRKKPAHVLEPGRALCGRGGRVGDRLGAAARRDRAGCTRTALTCGCVIFPWPRTSTHKAERGRLVVVSGHAWTTGAARLASRAGVAHRGRAGDPAFAAGCAGGERRPPRGGHAEALRQRRRAAACGRRCGRGGDRAGGRRRSRHPRQPDGSGADGCGVGRGRRRADLLPRRAGGAVRLPRPRRRSHPRTRASSTGSFRACSRRARTGSRRPVRRRSAPVRSCC